MENATNVIKIISGGICSVLSYIFGGLDMLFIVLIVFMTLDYLTGVLSAVYQKTLSSEIGHKGIIKKVMILVIIAVSHLIGQVMDMAWVRSFVIGYYLANEGISILENIGKTEQIIPSKLIEVLKQLQDKNE